ncbi:PRD domain-containing protein [Kocuria coralli]|uniref:PRD domain-containing protein n=1 Tax=Kocuria coralli TaxID=1461025 RepID=A0A5J5L000_9MICC|nr:PRD domain-containing protein [Kocuria coralli]
MEILRVFNNNVVLARPAQGDEVVLTGRGLGFQARPGQAVDESKVVRVFAPVDGRDVDHLGQLVAAVPPEHVKLAVVALESAGLSEVADSSPSLVVTLSDHLSFAIKRVRENIRLDYPLETEVGHLFPTELKQAQQVLAAVNEASDVRLPDSEAVAIALHLVNVGFTTGDLSYTYKLTGILQQLLEVVGQTYGRNLDNSFISVARFITHLRYLFVRIQSGKQLAGEASAVGEAIRTSQPEAYRCAERVAALLELRLDTTVTPDETAYLALHIARVVSDPRT